MKNGNLIQEKSFEFSLRVIKLYQRLQEKNEYVLSKQLLRSGTSIGANVEEATAAQSKKDFLHKMAIASKEARETRYWLLLLQKSDMVSGIQYDKFLEEITSIINILTKIVKTTSSKI